MIGTLSGWKTVRAADHLVLVPPEGAAPGRIVYRERVRPLMSLARALEMQLGELADQASSVLLVTDEGEHAVHATAFAHDGLTRHDVGLVFMDDYYACVHGFSGARANHERFGALVRALTIGDHHGLIGRRRYYPYTPPRGWQGLARGLETHWFPPSYPRERTTISVPPASPGVLDTQAFLRARLALDATAGFDVHDVRAEPPPSLGAGLEGVSYTMSGTAGGSLPFARELVVLSDRRFTYPLLLDCAGNADERLHARRCFHDVVRSIRPLPSRSHANSADVLNLWSE